MSAKPKHCATARNSSRFRCRAIWPRIKMSQTEWWYYTGHGETDSGKQFGFELVFFKRRTDLDKFSLVPLRLFGNPIYFAHFALTDVDDKKFRYAHRKSANGWFDMPARQARNIIICGSAIGLCAKSNGAHILRATIGSDVVFEATLKPTKKADFKRYRQRRRFVQRRRRGFALFFIFADGNGRRHHYGTAKPNILTVRRGWTGNSELGHRPKIKKAGIGFRFNLTDETELMCYQLRNSAGGVSEFSSGTFVAKDGEFTPLSQD